MSTIVHSSIDDQELISKRRRQFVAAATDLFGRTSYDSTTMKEISKQAGFSSGLIYSYVQTKEDMLFLVLLNLLESYLREIPKLLENVIDPIDRFCTSVRAYCQVVDANSDATLLAYRATNALSFVRKAEIKRMELETNNLVADCVQSCIDVGYFREVNANMLAYQLVLVAHGWALKRWILGQTMTLDDYINDTIEVFLRGVMTDVGWRHWEQYSKL